MRLAIAAALACACIAPSAATASTRAPYVKGEILVRFRHATSSADRATSRKRIGGRLIRSLRVHGVQLLRLRPGQSVPDALAAARRSGDVVYAQPNHILRATALPDDPLLDRQWGLHNSGQRVVGLTGAALADINAAPAWGLTTGSPNVKIAVVDTGVRAEHPDLQGNVGPGYDWIDHDSDPTDENGHGTHVAGIIGARGDNGIGGAGVDWHVTLMPLRVLDRDGFGDEADEADAFVYAGAHGAKIVNASFGGGGESNVLADAMRQSPGTLFVVSAGNTGRNNDVEPQETAPCGATNENLICVAATDERDRLASFSTYGPVSVDLAAPGTNVLSTYPALDTQWFDDFETPPGVFSRLGAGWGRTTAWKTGGTHSMATVCDGTFSGCGSADIGPPVHIQGGLGCTLEGDFAPRALGSDQLLINYSAPPDLAGTFAFIGGRRGGHFRFAPPTYEDLTVKLELEWMWGGNGASPSNPDAVAFDYLRYSCLNLSAPADQYEYLSGTSMSAPLVAGVAGLVLARSPGLSPTQVKARILAGTDQVPALRGKMVSGGRLDAYGALTASVPPDQTHPSGTIDTLAGAGHDGLFLHNARRVRALPGGGYLVAEEDWNRVLRIAPDGDSTVIAGNGQEGFSGDGGPATQAELDRPFDAAPTADGGVLIMDAGNARVRKVSPGGTITTVGGTGQSGYNGDGEPATAAQFEEPLAVAPMPDGGFLIGERYRVRRVAPGGQISTVAGGGQHPVAAEAMAPLPGGGFLVADTAANRIRKVAPNGTVTTVAGNGGAGFAGDGGPATSARIWHPTDVSLDGSGGFFVADFGNARIRHVTSGGLISTVAGTVSSGYSGDGGPAIAAQLESPVSVASTGGGAFLIADDNRIRAVTAPHGSAPAPAAPHATTTRARGLRADAGVLAGTAYSSDRTTTYHFEYGRTKSYGRRTPDAPLAGDWVPHFVAAGVHGLKAGTTYHFRLVTKNASGTSAGVDRSFRTPPRG